MELPAERSRVGWWVVGLGLFVVFAVFVRAFVGTFVLGLFVYYGARPVHRRLLGYTDSHALAATMTTLVIVVPALSLLGYTALVAFREFTAVAGADLASRALRYVPGAPESLNTLLRNPGEFFTGLDALARLRAGVSQGLRTLGAAATGLLHVTLALAFVFFLLRDGHRLDEWFQREIAGEGTVAHAFVSTVDDDLETVYFGNVVTVILVTAGAVVVYNGFALLAPAPLSLPFPTLLALLTGLATFVPLLVGKIVYVPVTAYLAWESLRVDPGLLGWPVGFFLVSLVFLDVLPQAVLRPYISGRQLHTGLVMFAYILGAAFFGWYGLFLGPMLAVLGVQFTKLVLPELLHGETLTPESSPAVDIGHEPDEGDGDADGDGDEDGGADERG